MSQIIREEDKEWEEWLRICDYCGWEVHGLLKPMRYHGRVVPYSGELGVGPMFYNELMMRIRKIQPIRMLFVGDAGSGKSYTAIHIAQILDKHFNINQIVFSGKDYLDLVQTIKPGRVIIIEEPTFVAAARTWYNEWQRIVTQTVESSRFQNNPLFIPVVNRNLLDKTIREYYVNYVVHVFERGIGRVYKTKHSQWQDKMIRTTAANMYIYQPGLDLTECDRRTCLGCKELPTCNKYIWPIYERKREQSIRYHQQEGTKRLKALEKATLTTSEYEKLMYKVFDKLKLTQKGTIDIESIRVVFEEEYDLEISSREARRLAKRAQFRHPELFQKLSHVA